MTQAWAGRTVLACFVLEFSSFASFVCKICICMISLFLFAAMPEDVFLLVFSYLGPNDLSRASCVNKSWRTVCYDPSVWKILDLSTMFHKGNLFDFK